jgi:hypothetical protein
VYNINIKKLRKQEKKPMSITALKDNADILSEHNYMWHGETLCDNYGATQEMMNEFWELVTKRIDEAYMEEYKAYHITHEESCNPNATYIGLCGMSIDSEAIDYAIEELGIKEDLEEWLDTTIEKLDEVINRVKADMDKILYEIVEKYNLTYVD